MAQIIKLRAWQQKAIQFFLENKGQVIWSVPTGSGKTYAAIQVIKNLLEKEPNLKILIIVPTNVILDMWQGELMKNDFMFNKIGIYNSNCKEYSKITLTTTSSAGKINIKIFDFLIIDEVHQAGTDRLLKILEHPFKYKLGMSATTEREDFKHWSIYRIFDYKIFEYSIKEALDDGILNKFEFYDVVLELTPEERAKYDEISISIGMMMKTIGSFHSFLALPNSDPRKQKLAGLINQRKVLVWNNKQKLEVVAKLVKEYYKSDSKIIIFSEYNVTTNSLYYYLGSEGIKSGVFHSSIKQEEREETLKRFELGNLNVILATKVLDQGINIPAIDIGIILAGEKTTRQAIQRLGRCLRKKEKNSKLFQLYIRDTFEADAAKDRSDFYKPLAETYEEIFIDDGV